MSRSTTAGTGEAVGGDRGVRRAEATADRERQHDRERHSLLARVTKANPSGCDAATIPCSPAAESCRPGPPEILPCRSARCDRQTVPDTTVCLDAVSRPNQRPAQPANVLAKTRRGDCLDQEAGSSPGTRVRRRAPRKAPIRSGRAPGACPPRRVHGAADPHPVPHRARLPTRFRSCTARRGRRDGDRCSLPHS